MKTILPIALVAVVCSSCISDLEEGNIDPNVQGEVNLQGIYTKCYASLIMEGLDGNADFSIENAGKSTLVRNLYNCQVLSTDEGICWWSDGGIVELGKNQITSGMLVLKFMYYRLMSNITYCNHFLELEEAKAEKEMYAEVRVIRAFNYFMMMDMFGNPPFVDGIRPETPRQAHTYSKRYDAGKTYTRAELTQMGREFMFDWVKSELEAAEPDLLPAQPEKDTDANYGRIDKGAAWLLLSRLYLNAGTYLNNDGQNNPHWDKALSYAEKVINSGYSLFDDSKMSAAAKANGYQPYDLLFMGDNGSNGASCEAILPLLQDGKKTKGWGGSMFFTAALWNESMRNVTGLLPGTTANNWAGMRARPEFVAKFTDNPESFVGKTTAEIRAMGIDDRALLWGCGSGNDERTLDLGDNSSFFQGLAITKWNNNYSNGGTPHDAFDVDTDFFLLRLAEAYLNAAEADMHINGEGSPKAKKYIDALRNRAHAATQGSYDLRYVLDERSREMYCELTRRTDLIRYNQFGGEQATYTWSYKGGSPSGTTFDKSRNLYPLYIDELLANSNLVQIDGYTELE